MNITYDKAFAPQFWLMLQPKLENHICPFCDTECTIDDFAGCIYIEKELRVFHGNIVCLIGLVDYQKEVEKNKYDAT